MVRKNLKDEIFSDGDLQKVYKKRYLFYNVFNFIKYGGFYFDMLYKEIVISCMGFLN